MGCTFQIPIVQSCSSWWDAVTQIGQWQTTTLPPEANDETMYDYNPNEDGTDNDTSLLHIWAATMEHDVPGTVYYDVDWTKTTKQDYPQRSASALIIGNEGNGLSDEIRSALRRQKNKQDDWTITGGTTTTTSHNYNIQAVYVPMESSVESLNAAVCGSVILFEYYRQVQTKQNNDSTKSNE
jgi:tRNA(Leu) C34 or U34 (ribose-2'-O)-methylase TrmL